MGTWGTSMCGSDTAQDPLQIASSVKYTIVNGQIAWKAKQSES